MNELLSRYWGKAHPLDENGPAYHLLPYHCLDVAAIANQWLLLDPSLLSLFERATQTKRNDLLPWLLFFVALHDLGKWDVRFQLKAIDIALKLNPSFADADPVRQYYHDKEGFRWFIYEFESYLFPQQHDQMIHWMKAVGAHHGEVPRSADPDGLLPCASEEVIEMDTEARRLWIKTLRDLFLENSGAIQSSLPDIPLNLLAGFCSVSDWLGSNSDYFKYNADQGTDLAVYLEQQQATAAKVLKDSGVLKPPVSEGGMSLLFPGFSPRGIQTKVEEWPLEAGLTIIEAPTGSGKTEAALSYASKLLHAGLADSIIFALPTQATANAMLDRLEEMAQRLFPESSSNIVLAHGKAGYNSTFKNLKKAAGGLTFQAKEEAYAQCSQWLGSSRKRVFLGQIGVCTVDQVLLSNLPVRHHFIREFGINRSILIVDEVHAYDSYMNTLLDNVLQHQAKAQGTAILLSATLPSQRRLALLKIWNQNTPQVEAHAPYPLVSHISTANPLKEWQLARPVESRDVLVQTFRASDMLPDQQLLKDICTQAQKGAKIAIICNIVGHAQSVARALQSMSQVPVDIFHSRFRFQDRNQKERFVISQYGKHAPVGEGRILVATQVIEQSLDLDFDWMITQLCPVDLLFQRWGRLHRHSKERPLGFEMPLSTVILPENKNYTPHSYVYENLRVLWRTEQLLNTTEKVSFPSAYREWIETVYQEEAWENEPELMTKAHDDFFNEDFSARSRAREISVSHAKIWQDTDSNASLLTRDGEMSLNVIPYILRDRARWDLSGQINFDKLAEYEKDEVLNLNTVPVPKKWCGYLPQDEEGVFYLPLNAIDHMSWSGETANAMFNYHLDYGLEMEKKA